MDRRLRDYAGGTDFRIVTFQKQLFLVVLHNCCYDVMP